MTTVTKYAQSCFLFEKDGKRLLLDPGNFDLKQFGREPADWPKIDVIVITHEHADHADLSTVQFLVERDSSAVITNPSFAEQLAPEVISTTTLTPGESLVVAGFSILGVEQKHGELSGGRPIPENMGFIIDDTFYTTGDSIPLETMPPAPVLFVPIAGPQMNFETARKMIEIVKPQRAIPMHYANTERYPIDLEELKNWRVPNTEIMILEQGQSFTWPQ